MISLPKLSVRCFVSNSAAHGLVYLQGQLLVLQSSTLYYYLMSWGFGRFGLLGESLRDDF